MRWCFEAAVGMAYLWGQHRCIHRDLAARNCLLADELRLKIAGVLVHHYAPFYQPLTDFGLSQLNEDSNDENNVRLLGDNANEGLDYRQMPLTRVKCPSSGWHQRRLAESRVV